MAVCSIDGAATGSKKLTGSLEIVSFCSKNRQDIFICHRCCPVCNRADMLNIFTRSTPSAALNGMDNGRQIFMKLEVWSSGNRGDYIIITHSYVFINNCLKIVLK